MTKNSIKNNWKNKEVTLETFSKCFLFLFFICKPMYIFKSGTFQIADFCLCLSFACLLVYKKFNLDLFKEDVLYFIFFACTLIINSVYAVIGEYPKFILSSMYYLYNFFAIVLLRYFYYDSHFLKRITWILRTWLYILAVMYLFGLGRYYGASRYMGTFNDPNQLGVYILMSFLFIKAYSKIFLTKGIILDDICMIFLVIATSSTGVTVGVVMYYILIFFNRLVFYIKSNRFDKFIAIVILAIFVISCFIIAVPYLLALMKASDLFIFQRISEKFSKIYSADSGLDMYTFLKDRNMTRIIDNPLFFLFGSGEAMVSYVGYLVSTGEIHSTIIGIFYYYGLLPFIVFCFWFVKNIKSSFKNYSWPTVIALICESFTLANQRQPLFWMFIVFVSYDRQNVKINTGLTANSSGFKLMG